MAAAEAKKVFERLFGTEVKGDLLVLFHQDPDLTDSLEGIASRIERPIKEVQEAVREFMELGLIEERSYQKEKILVFNKAKDLEFQRVLIDYLEEGGAFATVTVYRSSRSAHVAEAVDAVKRALTGLDMTVTVREIDVDKDPLAAALNSVFMIPTVDVGSKRIIGVPRPGSLEAILKELQQKPSSATT